MDLHEDNIRLPDGRVLHAYVAVPAGRVALTLYWHHGSPNIGQPPVPLFPLADDLGIRFVSHTRPGYTGSDRARDRRVVDVAPDAATVLDHLGVERFVSMGHSGGGAHSLALAARDPRCVGALAISGLAPTDAEGLDFFAGFDAAGRRELAAASAGPQEMERFLAAEPDAEPPFEPDDLEMFEGAWSWFMDVVRPSMVHSPDGFVDDDVAATHPWGFDPAGIGVPTVLLHGARDRMVPADHSRWLAGVIPDADLRVVDAGHLSVMRFVEPAIRDLHSRLA